MFKSVTDQPTCLFEGDPNSFSASPANGCMASATAFIISFVESSISSGYQTNMEKGVSTCDGVTPMDRDAVFRWTRS
jgi:hypothetical protein